MAAINKLETKGSPSQKDISSESFKSLIDRLFNFVEEHYPGMELGEELGHGSFATAYLFTCKGEGGNLQKKVLRIIAPPKKKVRYQKQFDLNVKNVSGEWLGCLAPSHPNVLATDQVIALRSGNYCLLKAERVQEFFRNPKSRQFLFGETLTIIGTVSEYIERSQDLKEALVDRNEPLSTFAMRKYAKQLLEAVRAIHARGLMHRDIKPENILIVPPPGKSVEEALEEGTGQLRLIDFGLSAASDPKKKRLSAIGSPIFRAPEQMFPERSGGYTETVDLYGVAMTLAFMVTGAYPIDSDRDILDKALEDKKALIADHLKQEMMYEPLRDLIIKLGHPDASQRLTVKEALEHPFFSINPFDLLSVPEEAYVEVAPLVLDPNSMVQPSPHLSASWNLASEEESDGAHTPEPALREESDGAYTPELAFSSYSPEAGQRLLEKSLHDFLERERAQATSVDRDGRLGTSSYVEAALRKNDTSKPAPASEENLNKEGEDVTFS